MSLARRTASSSEATRYSETTGPKVSSSRQAIAEVTPSSTVGSTTSGPMSGRSWPPVSTRAPLADGVVDVAEHLRLLLRR